MGGWNKRMVHVFFTILLNQLDRQKAGRRHTTQKQTPTSPDSKRHKKLKRGFLILTKKTTQLLNPWEKELLLAAQVENFFLKINGWYDNEGRGKEKCFWVGHIWTCVFCLTGLTRQKLLRRKQGFGMDRALKKGGGGDEGIAGATMECVGMLLVRRDVSVSLCLGWLPGWGGVWWVRDRGEGMG